MVGRGSDTNLSRPICDTILKRLEGPTKDRTAYWNAFARWISLHQHYIIDGDTYKRHTMPHEYNITIHKSIIRLRMKSQIETQPTSTLLAQAADLEPIPWSKKKPKKNSKQASIALVSDHRFTCTCNCCCSNLWATRTQQSHYHGYQD